MTVRPGRRVFSASATPFQPYDLDLIAVFEWQRPESGQA